jgi:hypothetical protein
MVFLLRQGVAWWFNADYDMIQIYPRVLDVSLQAEIDDAATTLQ